MKVLEKPQAGPILVRLEISAEPDHARPCCGQAILCDCHTSPELVPTTCLYTLSRQLGRRDVRSSEAALLPLIITTDIPRPNNLVTDGQRTL